jgi:hypothetical protein
MFVQIGNQAFDPQGATVRFWPSGEDEAFAVLIAANGEALTFGDEDYAAFMDWWTRCAGVARFPNGNGHRMITVVVSGGVVDDVRGLPDHWGYQVVDLNDIKRGDVDLEEAREQWK